MASTDPVAGVCLLMGADACRSAERQRLEQVVAPHPTDWAQGLREGTRTFQVSNPEESISCSTYFVALLTATGFITHLVLINLCPKSLSTNTDSAQTFSDSPCDMLHEMYCLHPAHVMPRNDPCVHLLLADA